MDIASLQPSALLGYNDSMLHQHQEPENQHLPIIPQTSEPQTADVPAHAPTPISIETEERTPDNANVLYSLQVDAPTETTTLRPTALSKAVLKDFQTVRIVRKTMGMLVLFTWVYFTILRYVVEYFLEQKTPGLLLPITATVSGLLLALIIGTQYLGKRAGKRLSLLNDPRIIGSLLDAYETNKLGSEIALTRLFPQMTQVDARHLSAQNRQQIYKLISQRTKKFYFNPRAREDHIQLRVAALKALERIGTREAAPIVKMLIASTTEPRIREAAERCLPYLEMRPEESEASLSLLRASSASDVHGADSTLLRPATDSGQSADELLRPG